MYVANFIIKTGSVHYLTSYSGKNIILVTLLGVIILFIYAVSVFVFLAEDFPNKGFLYCRTLGECVVSLLRSAVVNSKINVSISLTRIYHGEFSL